MRHIAVVLLLCSGCTGANVSPEGRPCSGTEPCGPGTFCDPATRTCKTGQSVDGSADLPADTGIDPDLPSLDLPRPDLFLVPDAGCPTGYTACGTECADLSASVDHCGACFNACPASADRCTSGTCVCGGASTPCAGGLNCKAGLCACIVGGLCDGCCDGNACLPVGATQSTSKCGAGGIACKSCYDSDPCTLNECDPAGQCQNPAGNNGDPCDDNDDCTHTDTCVAGQCQGKSTTCSDGLSCTTDACTGNPPPNDCTFAVQPGHCVIDNTCYADKAKDPADPCDQCLVSQSTSDWSQAAGCVFTFAGTGVAGYKDGAALAAQFSSPSALALGSGGKIYVTDRDNHVIRLIQNGQVSTFAGIPGQSGGTNGPALTARFNGPNGIALDSTGTKVYVAEWNGNRIRVIQGGQVSTLAGTGVSGFLDGPALSAQFAGPFDVATFGTKVYVADRGNHRIRLIENGQVSTFAGGSAGFANGALSVAQFNTIHGVTADVFGALYVADFMNNCIRRVAGGQVTTFAGQCQTSGLADGAAAQALFDHPAGVTVYGPAVYVSDEGNQVIRRIANGQVTTVAGSTMGMLDGPVSLARFHNPRRLAVDAAGLIYVPDADNHRIRLIRP